MAEARRFVVQRLVALLEDGQGIEAVVETSDGPVTLVFGVEDRDQVRTLLASALKLQPAESRVEH